MRHHYSSLFHYYHHVKLSFSLLISILCALTTFFFASNDAPLIPDDYCRRHRLFYISSLRDVEI